MLLVVTALRAAMAYLSTVALALAGNRVLTTVRADVFEHLQRLHLTWHAKAKAATSSIASPQTWAGSGTWR